MKESIIKSGFWIIATCVSIVAQAEVIPIENINDNPGKYCGRQLVIEGYAASPECYQIESGGCSGVPCSGDLVLQTELSGGPSIILSGNYNGVRIAAASDGCILSSAPLRMRWKYRVWGTCHNVNIAGVSGLPAMSIDSFKVIDRQYGSDEQNRSNVITEPGVNEKTVFISDSTGNEGGWFKLKNSVVRINNDDPFDTAERGKYTGRMSDGLWDGPWKQFYSNGMVLTEGAYKNGARTGLWKEWDSTGSITKQGQYLNGRENGIWKIKYRTDDSFIEADYRNENLLVLTEYFNNGVKKNVTAVNRFTGKIMNSESFYRSGKSRKTLTVSKENDRIESIEYAPAGNKKRREIYFNGIFIDTLWFESGKIWKIKKRSVRKDTLNNFTEYYENGKIRWRGYYSGFQPAGKWILNDSTGSAVSEINYGVNKSENSYKKLTDKYSKEMSENKSCWKSYTDFTNIRSVCTGDGKIWVGTNGGAACYLKDGTLEKTFTSCDGLPGNRITSVNTDKKGKIWFGTEHGLFFNLLSGDACCINIAGEPMVKLMNENGMFNEVVSNQNDSAAVSAGKEDACNALASFDGKSWEYHDSASEGGYVPPVLDISAGADNTLWYSGINGIRKVSSVIPENVRDRIGMNTPAIETATDTSLWAISFDTLFCVKNDSVLAWRIADYENTGELINLHFGDDKKLYILCAGMIVRKSGNSFRKVYNIDNMNVVSKSGFVSEGPDTFVFATDSGLVRNRRGKTEVIASAGSLGNEQITCFAKNNNEYWIGTKDGLYRAAKNRVEPIHSKSGIPAENIACVTQSDDGTIWAYAKDAQIYRKKDESWIPLEFSDEIAAGQIRSVSGYRDSSILIGTDNGLWLYDGSHEVNYKKGERLSGGAISGLCRIKGTDSINYVSDRYTVYSFDGLRNKVIYRQVPYIDGPINALTVDRNGNMWISDQKGISEIRKSEKVNEYTAANGLPLLPVNRIFSDSRNRMFAATVQAVYYLDGNNWRSIGTEDFLNGTLITGMTENADGEILIGTKKGLAVYGNDRNAEYPDVNGMLDRRINDVFTDRAGGLWVSTEKGLNSFKMCFTEK